MLLLLRSHACLARKAPKASQIDHAVCLASYSIWPDQDLSSELVTSVVSTYMAMHAGCGLCSGQGLCNCKQRQDERCGLGQRFRSGCRHSEGTILQQQLSGPPLLPAAELSGVLLPRMMCAVLITLASCMRFAD